MSEVNESLKHQQLAYTHRVRGTLDSLEGNEDEDGEEEGDQRQGVADLVEHVGELDGPALRTVALGARPLHVLAQAVVGVARPRAVRQAPARRQACQHTWHGL